MVTTITAAADGVCPAHGYPVRACIDGDRVQTAAFKNRKVNGLPVNCSCQGPVIGARSSGEEHG